MVQASVQASGQSGYLPPDDSEDAALMDEIAAGTLGDREQVEEEIDLMISVIRTMWRMEPDEVMQICSAFGARCAELAILLYRVEDRLREYKRVRTMQVQRIQDELERQYTIASRLLEVRRQDIQMSR